MKTLLLMRHAKAVADDGSLDDHSRPLAPRGLRDAPLMGKALRKLDLAPQLALVSSSVRTQQTLAGVIEGLRQPIVTTLRRELYLPDLGSMLHEIAQGEAADTLLVIGHNPSCEEVACKLCGTVSDAFHFPTGALACFQLAINHWGQLPLGTLARLEWLITPKLLDNWL